MISTYDGGTPLNGNGLREHDAAYGTAFTYRGNVTRRVTPGAVRNISYDIGGAVVGVDDGYWHTLAVTAAAGTNYAAPGLLTPNGTGGLANSYTYTPSLQVSSVTGPNAATASAVYDAAGRPRSPRRRMGR